MADPFQLDRLAEELADREATRPATESHQLPDYTSLSHNNAYLVAADFDVEKFLLSRSHMSLPDLRTELREYLSELKEELVKLINDDYEAFISLSTDLKDEGHRLHTLRSPLQGLKDKVLESQTELTLIQEALQAKLEKRALLREEKTVLHLLLRISESLTRLETLLLITSPEDHIELIQDNDSRMPANLSTDAAENRSRGNMAKHLSRVAAEYIQLVYHATKAKAERCLFFDEMQWRIDRIQSTISSDLDHLFATTLDKLIDWKGEGKVTEVEKSKLIPDLTECLRTYDVLGLWRDAEEVLRREVVRSFVKKTIYHGALAASHSPIIPHTPLPPMTAPSLSAPTSVPSRTPYTPFTVFFSEKQALTADLDSACVSTYARFLEQTDDPLARLYLQTLRFVERDLSRIMDIAESISFKSLISSDSEKQQQYLKPPEQTEHLNPGRFEILANVIWEELGKAIIDELGSTIFSSGRPDEFKKNFEISRAFLQALECLAPSTYSVGTMRSHSVFRAFEQQWQLPVYFQMRWKEIIGELEHHLAIARVGLSFREAEDGFASSQASSVWAAISACWSLDIFILELGQKFWRLTLQILLRFKKWLDHCLDRAGFDWETGPVLGEAAVGPSSLPRSAATVPLSGSPSLEQIAAEDTILREYSTLIIDIRTMRRSMLAMWHQEISMMLPEISVDDAPIMALQRVLSDLASLITPMSDQMIRILTKRCSDALLPVRSIPSQFRAMSNKHTPSEPSYFVTSILRPLKDFFGIETSAGPGKPLTEDYLAAYANQVFDNVVLRYVGYLSAMKKTEESLRRLKGKKNTYSLFGSSAFVKDEDGKDEARIQTQMVLDVGAFSKDAESLGVVLERSANYKVLKDIIYVMDGEES